MSIIHFVDTSVFVELLNVPHLNKNHEEVKEEYQRLVNNEDMFVLPIATLVETGNHIAHIPPGMENLRWSIAREFSEYVQKAINMEDNWIVLPKIEPEILRSIINQLPQQTASGTGFGDISIIEQFDDYWKNKQPIGEMRIWSTDKHLQSYSRTGGLPRRRNR